MWCGSQQVAVIIQNSSSHTSLWICSTWGFSQNADSDSGGLGQGLRFCVSNKLRGVAYVRATLLSKDADGTHGTESGKSKTEWD